jgi:hypothetical protein
MQQGALDISVAHVYESLTKSLMNFLADTDQVYDTIKRTFRCAAACFIRCADWPDIHLASLALSARRPRGIRC